MHHVTDDHCNFSLDSLGWNPFFDRQRASLADPLEPARVTAGGAGVYQVLAEGGPRRATLAGRLLRDTQDPAALPTAGDWVGLRPGASPLAGTEALIVHRFERRTCLRRKAAGRGAEAQVLAANIDIVLVVSSLNTDFNPRRLERYLEVVLDSGARPVFVLSKADLCAAPVAFVDAVRAIAPAAPITIVSAPQGIGLDALRGQIGRGETAALVGSSGVGKSTLANLLIGAHALREGEIRARDERGCHTTTRRELLLLPGGGLLLDTPGLREIEPWVACDSAGAPADGPQGFGDIAALAAACRFRDCGHAGEPGCAVERAIADGALDQGRLVGFHKLLAEGRHLRERTDARARANTKRRWKALSRAMRRHPKA